MILLVGLLSPCARRLQVCHDGVIESITTIHLLRVELIEDSFLLFRVVKILQLSVVERWVVVGLGDQF